VKNVTLVVAALVVVVLVFFSTAGHAQQRLGNQDVVKMVKAGLAEEVVLNVIAGQPTQFAVTPGDLIALKNEGVSDKIIAAMMSKSQPTVPLTNTVAAQRGPNQDKPSDAQILSAIRSDPNRNSGQSRTALVLSTTPLGSGARLQSIEVTIEGFRIIQWGEFNSAGKYWPVELCVNGTADNRVLAQFSPQERAAAGGPRGPSKFQTKAQYRLHSDDFGILKAEQILVSEWKPQDSICPAAPPVSVTSTLVSATDRLAVGGVFYVERTGGTSVLARSEATIAMSGRSKRIELTGVSASIRVTAPEQGAFRLSYPPAGMETGCYVYKFEIVNNGRIAEFKGAKQCSLETAGGTSDLKVIIKGDLTPGEYAFGPNERYLPSAGSKLNVVPFGID
jgi:hypothetical protein